MFVTMETQLVIQCIAFYICLRPCSATYEHTNCASWYHEDVGLLEAPSDFQYERECYWEFNPEQNQQVLLEIVYFQHENCEPLHVQLVSGTSHPYADRCGTVSNIAELFNEPVNISLHVLSHSHVSLRAYLRIQHKDSSLPSSRLQIVYPFSTWNDGLKSCETQGTGSQLYSTTDIPESSLDNLQFPLTGTWIGRFLSPWSKLEGCYDVNRHVILDLVSASSASRDPVGECAVYCSFQSRTLYGLQDSNCICISEDFSYRHERNQFLSECCITTSTRVCKTSTPFYMVFRTGQDDLGRPPGNNKKCLTADLLFGSESFTATRCDDINDMYCDKYTAHADDSSTGTYEEALDECSRRGARKISGRGYLRSMVWTGYTRTDLLVTNTTYNDQKPLEPSGCYYIFRNNSDNGGLRLGVDDCNVKKASLCLITVDHQESEVPTFGIGSGDCGDYTNDDDDCDNTVDHQESEVPTFGIGSGDCGDYTNDDDCDNTDDSQTSATTTDIQTNETQTEETSPGKTVVIATAISGAAVLVIIIIIIVVSIVKCRRRRPKPSTVNNMAYAMATYTSPSDEPIELQQTPIRDRDVTNDYTREPAEHRPQHVNVSKHPKQLPTKATTSSGGKDLAVGRTEHGNFKETNVYNLSGASNDNFYMNSNDNYIHPTMDNSSAQSNIYAEAATYEELDKDPATEDHYQNVNHDVEEEEMYIDII